MTRRILFIVMLILALPLSACASIPTSGDVQLGQQADEDRGEGVRYLPTGPNNGASVEEIVEGFLGAGTGIQNDFAIARQFLTMNASSSWQPTDTVLVTDGTMSTKSDGTSVTVTVTVFGEVDATGVYVTHLGGVSRTLRFGLEQISGQWRISSAPQGIVLISQAFDDLFEPRTLYFFDTQRANVVPDVRWFADDSQAETRAARMLFKGPADWLLEGSVATAFPASIRLVSDVRTEGENVIVNVSSEASTAASARDLSYMYLQLQLTLQQFVDSDQTLEMQVNGARLEVAPPAAGSVRITSEVSSKPLVATASTPLGYLNSDGTTELPAGADGVVEALSQYNVIRGALSSSHQSITFLTDDSRTFSMHFGDSKPTLVDARSSQIEPALDTWDFVWTQSTSERRVDVSPVGEASRTTVALPEGVSSDFVSHQVSRDGSRLAVLFNGSDGAHLAVMAIKRDETGKPLSLGHPIITDLAGTSGTDLAWIDPTTVAVLVNAGSGSVDVRTYRVGGQTSTYSPVQQALQVSGSNTLAGMRVVDQWGTMYAARGTGWRSLDATVRFVYAQT